MTRTIIIIIFLVTLGCTTTRQKPESKLKSSVMIEYYITARNANRGWYDNGVYHFPLVNRSVKVPYEQRSYAVSSVTDSIYERACGLIEFDLPDENIFRIDTSLCESGWTPRILLIVTNTSDTIEVDCNQNACSSGYKVFLSDSLLNKVYMSAPKELRESWLNDMPSRMW